MAVKSIKDINAEKIRRWTTTFRELDWLYGETDGAFGMPSGKISCWSAQSGLGKTRIAVTISKRISSVQRSVLYFQNEVPLGTFKEKISTMEGSDDNIYISDSENINNIVEDIKECILDSRKKKKPLSLVVLDSINMVEEYGNGGKKACKSIIDGDALVLGLREIDRWCYKKRIVAPHILIINQLNKNGEPAGSSVLPHLVDAIFDIVPDALADGQVYDSNQILLRLCPKYKKNRYCGRLGTNPIPHQINIYHRQDTRVTVWYHCNNKVECLEGENSSQRRRDKIYCQITGEKYISEEVEKIILDPNELEGDELIEYYEKQPFSKRMKYQIFGRF